MPTITALLDKRIKKTLFWYTEICTTVLKWTLWGLAYAGLIFYLQILSKWEGKAGKNTKHLSFKWNQLLKYLYLLKRKAIKSEKKEK